MKDLFILIADQEELKLTEYFDKFFSKRDISFFCLNVSPIPYWKRFLRTKEKLRDNILSFSKNCSKNISYKKISILEDELFKAHSSINDHFDLSVFKYLSGRRYTPYFKEKKNYAFKYLKPFLNLIEKKRKKYRVTLFTPYVSDITKQLIFEWAKNKNVLCLTLSDASYKQYHFLEVYSQRIYGKESVYFCNKINQFINLKLDHELKKTIIKGIKKNQISNQLMVFNNNEHRELAFSYYKTKTNISLNSYRVSLVKDVIRKIINLFRTFVMILRLYYPYDSVITDLFGGSLKTLLHILNFIDCEIRIALRKTMEIFLINKRSVHNFKSKVKKSDILVFLHFFPEGPIISSNSLSRHELSDDFVNFINSHKNKDISFIEHPIMVLEAERSSNYLKKLKEKFPKSAYILSTTIPPRGFDFSLIDNHTKIVSINGSITLELASRRINSSIVSIHPLLLLDQVKYKNYENDLQLIFNAEEYKKFVSENCLSYYYPSSSVKNSQIERYSEEIVNSYINLIKNI